MNKDKAKQLEELLEEKQDNRQIFKILILLVEIILLGILWFFGWQWYSSFKEPADTGFLSEEKLKEDESLAQLIESLKEKGDATSPTTDVSDTSDDSEAGALVDPIDPNVNWSPDVPIDEYLADIQEEGQEEAADEGAVPENKVADEPVEEKEEVIVLENKEEEEDEDSSYTTYVNNEYGFKLTYLKELHSKDGTSNELEVIDYEGGLFGFVVWNDKAANDERASFIFDFGNLGERSLQEVAFSNAQAWADQVGARIFPLSIIIGPREGYYFVVANSMTYFYLPTHPGRYVSIISYDIESAQFARVIMATLETFIPN